MASDPTQPGGRQPDLLGQEEDADIPPPPRGLEAPLDGEAEERLERMSRRGRSLPMLLVVVAIGAFVAIVWWAYRTANQPETPGDIPVVQAEPGEEKVRPEAEGGMDVPNQDKLIYQQLGQNGNGAGEGQPEIERLLPPPEEPMEPPAAPETAAETAGLTPPPPPQDTPDEVLPETPAEGTAALPEGEAAPAGQTAEAAPEAAPQAAPAAPVEAEPIPAPAAEAPADPAPAAPAAAEPAVEEPAPQQVAAADGAFRIQLAAVKSEADAKREWARLQQTYAELLGPLHSTIQRAELDQGVFYRIQGGPLPSREAADSLCAQLKQKNQACLVVKP